MSNVFDKFKRYRDRKKDHKVAVRLDVSILPTSLRDVPVAVSSVSLTLERDQRSVKFPSRPVTKGAATWDDAVSVVCTVYRDPLRASLCDPKVYDVILKGKSASGKTVVSGRATLDIAEFAFKGAGPRPTQLSIPLKLHDKGYDTIGIQTATLVASISAAVVQDAPGVASSAPASAAPSNASFKSAQRSLSFVSIASGLSDGSDASRSRNGSEAASKPSLSATKTPGARRDSRAERRQAPSVVDREQSATRIANTRRRLKEKAALLAKSAPPVRQPPRERDGEVLDSGDEAQAVDRDTDATDRRRLFDRSRQQIRGQRAPRDETKPSSEARTEARAKAVEVRARASSREDILLDATSLDIPAPEEVYAVTKTGPSAISIAGPRSASPQAPQTPSDDLSELSDSLSEVEEAETNQGVAVQRSPPRRTGSLLEKSMSLWEKGWGALLPSKGSNDMTESPKARLAQGAGSMDLRIPSTIRAAFMGGSSPQRQQDRPPLLQGEDLPYSDDSASSAGSEGSRRSEYAVRTSSGVGRAGDRDEAHLQKIAAAASLLRTTQLSKQSSLPKFQLEPHARTIANEVPSPLPIRTPTPKASASSETERPAGRRLKTQPGVSRRGLLTRQRKETGKAHDSDTGEESASRSNAPGLENDRLSPADPAAVQDLLQKVSESQTARAARVSRLTDEIARTAAALQEKQDISDQRMLNAVGPLTPQRVSAEPPPAREGPNSRQTPAEISSSPRVATQRQGGGSSTVSTPRVGVGEPLPGVRPSPTSSLDFGRDQRRVKELQLELRLAEERIALLEASGTQTPSTEDLAFDRQPSRQDPTPTSPTASNSLEQKLSAELQNVRLCLAEMEVHIDRLRTQRTDGAREHLIVAVSKASDHAAAAKELIELIKKQEVVGQAFQAPELRTATQLPGARGIGSRTSSSDVSDVRDRRQAMIAAEQEVAALRARCQSLEERDTVAEAQKAELARTAESHRVEAADQIAKLEEELRLLRGDLLARDRDAVSLLDVLRPFAQAATSGPPLQQLAEQVQALVAQYVALKAVKGAPGKAPKGKERTKAQLEQKLAEQTRIKEELQVELELLKRESGAEATSLAVAVALAPKEAQITALERQLADLEYQAQSELGDMHEELLDMRQACHDMELALSAAETKGRQMQLEKQQMQQQLQETAGNLIEAERELSQRTGASPRKGPSRHGQAASLAEEAELGPGTPPAQPPARVASRTATDDSEKGHIVGLGSAAPLYEQLRRDFDAMMQELVQKKLELAELSEVYERVCHAFLKADEARNAPILASLRLDRSLSKIPAYA